MTPTRQPTVPKEDLFGIVTDALERSINQPNILNYGEKDYPEQRRFHQSDKRGRFISGGNRGGKTDSIVVESIWWATNTHRYLKRPESWGNGPITQRFVVVDVSKGVEQIMLPKFQRWVSRSMLVDGRWDKSWDAKNLILTFANGSTIDFVTHGMELSKLGGVPRHVIYFDEEPPRHIFNESMMRLIDYNGFWVISATPVKGMGWTYDLLWEPALENPEGNVSCFTLSMEDNPYVEAEEEDRDFYMQGMDVQERAMREKGSFVARSGLVFPNFNTDTHVIDEDTFDYHSIRNWEWYSSADFGINNPTAWLWHAVSPQGDIVTFGEHYKSDMSVPQHSAVVFDTEDRFARLSGRDGTAPDVRVGDPAGKQRQMNTGTSVLTEYALRGINIQVEGIPHDAMIGVEKMRQYFEVLANGSGWGPYRPKWVILSSCPMLIKELKKLRWATYSSEKLAYDVNKREEIHKKDDHAFDSAKYFATLMPDLTPVTEAVSGTVPVTISYQDMMARLANDDTVTFVDNQESEYATEWETTESYEELYEGAYDG